jgi:hypothetical protein
MEETAEPLDIRRITCRETNIVRHAIENTKIYPIVHVTIWNIERVR